jgi:glutathione S-transferase
MDLELVSYKLCPYVQRVVITLQHRQVPFRITFIDLDDPPEWFLEDSPFGKVPILKVDGTTVLFESAVINEFVDEVAPGPRMLPDPPLARAVNRAWTELGSSCLGDHWDLQSAKDARAFKRARESLVDKLERLEGVLGAGPYFNGASLSLVDTAFAPLFMRLAILQAIEPIFDSAELPKTAAWSRVLLGLPLVRDSVVPEFRDLYLADLRKRRGYLASRLAH